MPPDRRLARRLMDDFARRTGLVGEATPRRYLWTDAYAVGNFLGLDEVGLAGRLVDQVHHVLGRHRDDDPRRGWISGLEEEDGERHPTRGGLRIGKPMPEGRADEPTDPRQEWDRDGQYLHYLTRWMHALTLVARTTGEARFHRWAVELARTSHHAFAVRPEPGLPPLRLVWKMSITLDRPLVPSMGHHDPLDLLLSHLELAAAQARFGSGEEGTGLEREIAEAMELCRGSRWATEDPLGIGGLLADVARLARLQVEGSVRLPELLEDLLEDAAVSLAVFHRSAPFEAPVTHRLAFRELGLAIGLRAVEFLADDLAGDEARRLGRDAAERAVGLLRFRALADAIDSTWSDPAARRSSTWLDHEDINAVMLATALAPEGWLGRAGRYS